MAPDMITHAFRHDAVFSLCMMMPFDADYVSRLHIFEGEGNSRQAGKVKASHIRQRRAYEA